MLTREEEGWLLRRNVPKAIDIGGFIEWCLIHNFGGHVLNILLLLYKEREVKKEEMKDKYLRGEGEKNRETAWNGM